MYDGSCMSACATLYSPLGPLILDVLFAIVRGKEVDRSVGIKHRPKVSRLGGVSGRSGPAQTTANLFPDPRNAAYEPHSLCNRQTRTKNRFLPRCCTFICIFLRKNPGRTEHTAGRQPGGLSKSIR